MKKFLWIVLILIVLVACGTIFKPQWPISQKILTMVGVQVNTGNTQIANPASVYCEQNSGTLEIVTDLSGGQSGLCHLTGGKICDEWAYFRGECGINDNGQQINLPDLGISFYLPINRTILNQEISDNILTMKVDIGITDDKGYKAYVDLEIEKINNSDIAVQIAKPNEMIGNVPVATDKDYLEEFANLTENTPVYDLGVCGYAECDGVKFPNNSYMVTRNIISDQPQPQEESDGGAGRFPVIPDEEGIINLVRGIIDTLKEIQ